MHFKWFIISLLVGCSGFHKPQSEAKSAIKKEAFDLQKSVFRPLVEEPRYTGGGSLHLFQEELNDHYWDIPKSAFQCRGSKINSMKKIAGVDFEDCGGFHDEKEWIAPAIVEFLNRFQNTYQKRLTVLIGWRCPKHEAYIESKDSYQEKNKTVVKLEGVHREELQLMMEKILNPHEPIEIYREGFLLDDKDLWGESNTVLVKTR
jgi:hypothetical protein